MDIPRCVEQPFPVDGPLSDFHFRAIMKGLMGTHVPVGRMPRSGRAGPKGGGAS